jgi:hypothetical protein
MGKLTVTYSEYDPTDRHVREMHLAVTLVSYSRDDFDDLSPEDRAVITGWLAPRTIELHAQYELDRLSMMSAPKAHFDYTKHNLIATVARAFEDQVRRAVGMNE